MSSALHTLVVCHCQQQRKYVGVATRGSDMTSRLAFLVTVANARTGTQESVEYLGQAVVGSADEGRRLTKTRQAQARVGINQTTRKQRLHLICVLAQSLWQASRA
jgi:hypothetical protein